MADNNLDFAIQLVAGAERAAQTLRDSNLKQATLTRVAQAIAAGDPDYAERIALAITDQRLKARGLTRMAETITTMNWRLSREQLRH